MTFLTHNQLQITHHKIPLSRLPQAFTAEKEFYRIVQISDLHFYEFSDLDYFEAVKLRIHELQPDLLVMTGDAIHYGRKYLPIAQAFLSQLSAKDGKFAVLGNHDYKDDARGGNVSHILEAAGFNLLKNQRTDIQKRGGARIWVAGLDDFKYGRPDVPAALSGLDDPHEPILLLAHNPRLFDRVKRFLSTEPDISVDLMLAGHTHAGHVFLPPLLPIYRYVLMMKYRYGFYHSPKATLYVTSGLGSAAFYLRNCLFQTGFPRFRYNTKPEIAVLDWINSFRKPGLMETL